MLTTENRSILLFLDEAFAKHQQNPRERGTVERVIQRISDSILLLENKEEKKVFFGELWMYLNRKKEILQQTQQTQQMNVGFLEPHESLLVGRLSRRLRHKYSQYLES